MILSRALLSSLDAWNVYSIGPLYRVSRLGTQLEIYSYRITIIFQLACLVVE